jgi:protein SCO1/2
MDRRALFTGANTAPLPSASLGPDYYTNAVLRTQDGEEVRFYDDLIKDKIVAINFIYTQCEGACPLTTSNLVRVQKLLGKRLGRDIFMYTLTLKPWQDDAAALEEYAKAHGVGPGWKFLTGDDYDLTTIRFKLFRWDHPALDFNLEQHTGMVRVINDRQDRWSMCPTLATPEQIVDAIAWAEPTKPLAVRQHAGYAIQAKRNAEARALLGKAALARA